MNYDAINRHKENMITMMMMFMMVTMIMKTTMLLLFMTHDNNGLRAVYYRLQSL